MYLKIRLFELAKKALSLTNEILWLHDTCVKEWIRSYVRGGPCNLHENRLGMRLRLRQNSCKDCCFLMCLLLFFFMSMMQMVKGKGKRESGQSNILVLTSKFLSQIPSLFQNKNNQSWNIIGTNFWYTRWISDMAQKMVDMCLVSGNVWAGQTINKSMCLPRLCMRHT